MKQMTFAAACKEYFGFRGGQTAIEFMKEIKELTPEDREYFKGLFPSVGYNIVNAI